MFRSARISTDGAHRAVLYRWLDPACKAKCCSAESGSAITRVGYLAWVLNNPSKADGLEDDPTIRRLWTFTRAIGFHQMHVVNTNSYRATEPKDARTPSEEYLAINDQWLAHTHAKSGMTICAWGDKANPDLVARTVRALYALGPLHALRVTKQGNPQHPLYLPAITRPQLWSPKKWIN